MRIFFLSLMFCLSSPVFSQSELSVLTFNVYAKPDPFNFMNTEERMNRICEQLKQGSWDVVLLQEVWTTHYRRMFRNCGFDYFMDIENSDDNSPEASLGSGLLILSKYPMINMKRLILSRPEFSWGSLIHGEVLVHKSLYISELVLSNKKILWIANTHLTANYCETTDYSKCDSYEDIRLNQLKEIAIFIKKYTKTQDVILAGDFNSGPQPFRADKGWRSFSKEFAGYSQSNTNSSITCTSCASNSFKKTDGGMIDHIFVSEKLLTKDSKRAMELSFFSKSQDKHMNLSDHYGWQSIIQWQEIRP